MELLLQSPTETNRFIRPANPKAEELEEQMKASPGGIRLYPNGMIVQIHPEEKQYTLRELSEAVEGVVDLIISRSLKHIFVFDENAGICCREVNENATLLLNKIGYSKERQLLGIVLVIPSGLFI